MNILKIMFEINTKIEIKQILDKILKWSGRSKKSNEESKEDQIYSIPKELYGQKFELCRFPTQVLEKIKEMESKIKSMAKEAIEYQKVFKIIFSLFILMARRLSSILKTLIF